MKTFRELHHGPRPLLLPNPWDVGTARLFEAQGFEALATTSAGLAATFGKLDNQVTREQALEHASQIADSTQLPVSGDLENGFADSPEGVAQTVAEAAAAGLAGGSIEDFTGDSQAPIYALGHARERIVAAVEAARSAKSDFVLTARAENFLNGRPDLDDTIARLVAFCEAGADVVYAPGLTAADDIRAVVAAVDRPLNVLALPGVPSVASLQECGVARISVGSGFHRVAFGAAARAAQELLESGTYGYWADAAGADLMDRALG